jgi:hypothetical protein
MVHDHLSCGSALDGDRCAWNSYDRSFAFTRWPPGIPAGASRAALIFDGKILFSQAAHGKDALPATGAPNFGSALGFGGAFRVAAGNVANGLVAAAQSELSK